MQVSFRRSSEQTVHAFLLCPCALTEHLDAQVFHEGLKSWSCCPKQTELDFDQFMKIEVCDVRCVHLNGQLRQMQGCQVGLHTPEPEKPKVVVPPPSAPLNTPLSSENVTEVFSSGPPAALPLPSALPSTTVKPAIPIVVPVEEEDDHSIAVSPGTQCKRSGCKVEFVSDDVNRKGDGEGTVCTYHPGKVGIRSFY